MNANFARPTLSGLILLAVGLAGCQTGGNGTGNGGNSHLYRRTDLVSDQGNGAPHTDPNLVNPWGIASNPGSFFWIANNGTGTSTLYDADGVLQSKVIGGPVDLPAPGGGTAAPTGLVGNPSNDFMMGPTGNSAPAQFLFATEDGTILGWSGDVDASTASILVDNTDTGAIYKGLAISTSGGPSRLYATNFASGAIDVFGPDLTAVTTLDQAAFTDPSTPNGFVPFGIQAIDDHIFVTWVQPDSSGVDEVAGAGLGHVSEFDRDGALVDTVSSGGRLDAPWAVARAPDGFGKFGGDLLVGNFGDGRITAYDMDTFDEKGQLESATGSPIAVDGLWGLMFGDGRQAGLKDELYFTAGPADEAHGLFGRITPR